MRDETLKEVREILRRVVYGSIALRWKSSQSMPGAGERRSHFQGCRHDFDGLDEYAPGDDPRSIGWNATARTGGLAILRSVYMEPRDIKVFVLTDVGRSMDFGTTRATKRHLAAEMVGSIIKAAEETHDRVGFMAYSPNQVEKYIPTRSAQRMFLPALVSTIEGRDTRGHSGSGLTKSLSLLPQTRSLVYVVSDFLHLSERDRSALRRAALRHDLVCVMVQDKRERELPPVWGFYTLTDLGTGDRKTLFLTKKKREEFAASFRRHEQELLSFFRKSHCRWFTVSTEEGDSAIPRVLRLFATSASQAATHGVAHHVSQGR